MKRSPNPHLTFGHGIHTCLDNPLARLEARIVLGNGFVSVTIKNNIQFGRKNTCEYTIPESVMAYSRKGYALNAIKRYKEALVACDWAIQLEPTYARAYRYKGYKN